MACLLVRRRLGVVVQRLVQRAAVEGAAVGQLADGEPVHLPGLRRQHVFRAVHAGQPSAAADGAGGEAGQGRGEAG
jgi:hypothetical protein